jgi:hypothetical protein
LFIFKEKWEEATVMEHEGDWSHQEGEGSAQQCQDCQLWNSSKQKQKTTCWGPFLLNIIANMTPENIQYPGLADKSRRDK